MAKDIRLYVMQHYLRDQDNVQTVLTKKHCVAEKGRLPLDVNQKLLPRVSLFVFTVFVFTVFALSCQPISYATTVAR